MRAEKRAPATPNWDGVVEVPSVDSLRKKLKSRKKKVKTSNSSLYHVPRQLYKKKIQKKTSKWTRSRMRSTPLLTYWTKNPHKKLGFERKYKKQWMERFSEYESSVRTSDWTHQETELLFKLCNQFEQRFFVVTDR